MTGAVSGGGVMTTDVVVLAARMTASFGVNNNFLGYKMTRNEEEVK